MRDLWRPLRRVGILLVMIGLTVSFGSSLASTAEAPSQAGWTTSWDPFVTLVGSPTGAGGGGDDQDDDDDDEDDEDDERGNWVRALITSGDVLPNGFTFSNIPDGIGAVTQGEGTMDVFVNHELNNGPNHGGWAKVSRLRYREGSTRLLRAELAVDGSQGYERFCSGSAVQGHGFRHPVYFANEEVDDGIVVGVDAKTREIIEMPWLGEFSHENTIHVPWFYRAARQTVVLSFEDGPATESEVYLYVADTPRDLLAGRGQLYVFGARARTTYNSWDDI